MSSMRRPGKLATLEKMMPPHKHHVLTVQEAPPEPVTTTGRPLTECLERYLLDVSQVRASDIAHWHRVPDFDAFEFVLKDGKKFEVSGQAIEFWMKTAID
jgi:hypothetical protein